MKIAADLAEQIGVDAPIGRLTRDLWADARGALGVDQDHTRATTHWDTRAVEKIGDRGEHGLLEKSRKPR